MKRSSIIRLTVLIAFLWVMGSVVSIWAAEFSADSVSTYKGKTTTGKIYMKNKFIRMESNHDGYESVIPEK
jgi:hypothetical protein